MFRAKGARVREPGEFFPSRREAMLEFLQQQTEEHKQSIGRRFWRALERAVGKG